MATVLPSPAAASLRVRKRARTRDAIVAAGLELFLSRGFEQTTVADIADAAEVSPATVFRYFGTKEALLFANHEQEELALQAAVRRHRHLGEPRAVMTAAVLELAAELHPEQERYAERIRVIAGSATLLGAALRTRAGWEVTAARELADSSSREPTLADAVVAGAALGALHAAVTAWFTTGGSADLEQLTREALSTLWPDLSPTSGT